MKTTKMEKAATPPARADLEARDKQRVAYHEAGHAVVAWKLGAKVQRVQVTPFDAPDLTEERAWEGSATYSRGQASEPVIGWAGIIAERMLAGEWFPGAWADVETGELSDTDLEAIESGENWARDSNRAEVILRYCWRNVAAVAEELIAGEVVTDGMFAEIMKGGRGA